MIADIGGDGCGLLKARRELLSMLVQRLIYIMGQFPYGCAFVSIICITCEFRYSQWTNYGYRSFCFKEMRHHLQFDVFDHLGDKNWNRIPIFCRLVCESIGLIRKRLCIGFLCNMRHEKLFLYLSIFSHFLRHVNNGTCLTWWLRWTKSSSKLMEDADEFLFLRWLLRLSSQGLSVFLIKSVVSLRGFACHLESDAEKEAGGERR